MAKILVLDGNFYGLRSYPQDDLVVHEAWDIYPGDNADAEFFGLLEAIPAYDVVIVGNNLGHGLEVVPHLPMEQRGRTLITSNYTLPPAQRAAYEHLGCSHFCTRDQIYHALASDFGIEA